MQVTKLVMRNIYGGKTNEELGLFNADETMDWINEFYLKQGFKVLNSGYMVSPNPTMQGGLGSHMFYWVLVKEVADPEKPAKAKEVKE